MLNKNRQTSNVDVDCLLPNGLLISLNVNKDSTLNEILAKLNQETSNLLKTKIECNNLIFTSLNEEAQSVEFYDTSKKLCELSLFHEFLFFKLVDSQKPDQSAKSYKVKLNTAIGFNVDEIETSKNIEQNEFRLELMRIVKGRIEKENEPDSDLRFMSMYSPNLEVDSTRLLLKKPYRSQIKSIQDLVEIKIFIFGQHTKIEPFNLIVRLDQTPDDILEFVKLKMRESEDDSFLAYFNNDDLVLNTCGFDEILYGNLHKIGSYKYVQKCINSNKKPTFFINSKKKICDKLKSNDSNVLTSIDKVIRELEIKIDNYIRAQPEPENEAILSWDVNKPFVILFDFIQIFYKVSIYNGLEQIGEEITSKIIESDEIDNYHYLTFREKIEFKLKICELHRNSKLCLTLNYLSKKNKEIDTIGWIVLNLFDYKSNLISGKKNLYLWPGESASVYSIMQEKTFFNLCLSGVSGQNPNKDYAVFKVEFLNDSFIYYPTRSQIMNYYQKSFHDPQDECLDLDNKIDKNLVKIIEIILSKDPLTDLSERDKNFLWTNRLELLRNYPNSLPRLLQSVDWLNRQEVAEIYNLLSKWPILSPVIALELLNCKYFDIEIRNFAVRCLDKLINDEEIQSYLLQLVQAIKNESYLNNELSKFLLTKALSNQRTGFDFFWQLKSELKNLRHQMRFTLMLEAYCRGIGSDIKVLTKQIEAISFLTSLSNTYKNIRDFAVVTKEEFIKQQLETAQTIKRLSNYVNPMNRSQTLGSIDTTKCRVLSSKKSPIFISYLNISNYGDLNAENYNIIFKHGDDLRQDMLTLQMLKLMNTIWKNEGLDLKY